MLLLERAPALDDEPHPSSAQAWKLHMDSKMDSKMAASRPHHHPRVEDDALVRGAGHFIADRSEPKQAFGWFARSPHAFARIGAIDVERARRAPGVRAVLTAADMDAAGVGTVGRHPPLSGRGGPKR